MLKIQDRLEELFKERRALLEDKQEIEARLEEVEEEIQEIENYYDV